MGWRILDGRDSTSSGSGFRSTVLTASSLPHLATGACVRPKRVFSFIDDVDVVSIEWLVTMTTTTTITTKRRKHLHDRSSLARREGERRYFFHLFEERRISFPVKPLLLLHLRLFRTHLKTTLTTTRSSECPLPPLPPQKEDDRGRPREGEEEPSIPRHREKESRDENDDQFERRI